MGRPRSSLDYTVHPEGHRPTLYDFHLSSEHTFWSGSEYHEEPSALNINIHHGMEICIGLTGLGEFSCGDSVLPIHPGDAIMSQP